MKRVHFTALSAAYRRDQWRAVCPHPPRSPQLSISLGRRPIESERTDWMLDKLIDGRTEARTRAHSWGLRRRLTGQIDRLTESRIAAAAAAEKAIAAWIEIEIEAKSNVYLSQAAQCVPIGGNAIKYSASIQWFSDILSIHKGRFRCGRRGNSIWILRDILFATLTAWAIHTGWTVTPFAREIWTQACEDFFWKDSPYTL